MIRLWFVWVALMWPIFGNAEPLTVQTGEHDAFTRVVITIPANSDWQLGRQSDGYRLQAATRDGFALDNFFDLIPRSRIVEVIQIAERGELFLRIGCDCNAQATVLQSRFLVIDVADGTPIAESRFELPFPERTVATQAPLPDLPERTLYRPSSNRILPLITPRAMASPDAEVAPAQVPDSSQEQILVRETTPDIDVDQTLRAVEQSLTESLGRGLSEGLLEKGLIPAERDPVGQIENEGLNAQVTEPFPGLKTQTAIDPLAVEAFASTAKTQVGQTCLPREAFDIVTWGTDAPPHEQLSGARGALINDADQILEDGALQLARLYVFLGFGREAQQVLGIDGVQSRERVIVREIAQIIDDEISSTDLFSGQVSCPSNVALWALLAQETAPIDGQVDRAAVVNAFNDLPVYVQSALEARLTEALLLIGAEDEAMQILGRDLPDNRNNVDLALAGAALADALGENAQAIEIISDVARNAQRTTPEAMTRFFREGIRNEVRFSDEDFLLADALRFEVGESPFGAALVDAQFEAYLYADRFEDGRAFLDARRDDLSNARAKEAESLLLSQATERSPDGDFLEFIWQEAASGGDTIARQLVAQRLVDLGFPDRAVEWLDEKEGEEIMIQQARLERQVALDDEVEGQGVADRISVASEVSPTSILNGQPATQNVAGPSLQNSRNLVESAEESRAIVRALLQSNPAPAEF